MCLGFLLWPQKIAVHIGTANITATVVANDTARNKGLGGRESLAKNEGMLFVFPTDDRWGFWMKDMRFAIDIVWLDQQKQVVWVERSVDPATYPATLEPPTKARYVLELPSGTADANGITPGAIATFSLQTNAK